MGEIDLEKAQENSEEGGVVARESIENPKKSLDFHKEAEAGGGEEKSSDYQRNDEGSMLLKLDLFESNKKKDISGSEKIVNGPPLTRLEISSLREGLNAVQNFSELEEILKNYLRPTSQTGVPSKRNIKMFFGGSFDFDFLMDRVNHARQIAKKLQAGGNPDRVSLSVTLVPKVAGLQKTITRLLISEEIEK